MTMLNPLGVMNSLNNMTSKTGFGGLVSGMDLEELVVGLTSANRLKIAKEQQNVQKLEWKQDAYRTVTKALEEFQESYLDILSSTNMRSASFFTTKKVDVSSPLISVIPSARAMAGSISIDKIEQLADSQRIIGAGGVTRSLTGELDLENIGVAELLDNIADRHISLNLDGRVRTVSFNDEFIEKVNSEGLEEALQDVVDKAYGVKDAGHRIIGVTVNEGKLNFEAKGSELIVKAVDGDLEVLQALGLRDGQSNRLDLYKSIEDASLASEINGDKFEFTINGVDFSFDKTTELMDVMSKVNGSEAGVTLSYSALSDSFSLTSKETGAGELIQITETQGNLLAGLKLTMDSGAGIEYGKNAMLRVNGVEISRSSNVFSVDGVSIELHGKTEEKDLPIKVNLRDDSSAIKEPIENFIKDYNALVDLLGNLISERPNSKYEPLTDEQKNEMSEKQIEKWEAEAKKGLLANDPALRGLLNDLRSAMRGSAKPGGVSLFDMGISTGNYQDNGKLTINDQAKFMEALKTRGEAISELFTTSEKGIAVKLQGVIEDAIRKTGDSKSRGRLIQLAGIEKSTSDTENNITRMIDQANKRVEALKTRLATEENRLWRQFTAMETALSRMEAQSSMLMQFAFNG